MSWSPLDERTASMIMSMRMDLTCILESDGTPPPVMFANYHHLARWAAEHGLVVLSIDSVRATSAVRVRGDYKSRLTSTQYCYDQVWVRGRYTRYKKVLSHAADSFLVGKSDLSDVHADHVINRARLKLHPDAWVVIFPVHRKSNSPFGYVEKQLSPIAPAITRVDLPPLMALKLFCGRLPRTEIELAAAMVDIRGCFLTCLPQVAEYCDAIERESLQYMRKHRQE